MATESGNAVGFSMSSWMEDGIDLVEAITVAVATSTGAQIGGRIGAQFGAVLGPAGTVAGVAVGVAVGWGFNEIAEWAQRSFDGSTIRSDRNLPGHSLSYVGTAHTSEGREVTWNLDGFRVTHIVAAACLDVIGRDGDDYIEGCFRDGEIRGMTGSDFLSGNGGRDSLYGGAQDDKLYGNQGDDFLFGGDGNDRMQGGEGRDKLTGGNGADIFDLTSDDRVLDFRVGTDNVVDEGVYAGFEGEWLTNSQVRVDAIKVSRNNWIELAEAKTLSFSGSSASDEIKTWADANIL
jgi:Ca2+-binding RTX toxin-like protein